MGYSGRFTAFLETGLPLFESSENVAGVTVPGKCYSTKMTNVQGMLNAMNLCIIIGSNLIAFIVMTLKINGDMFLY